MDAFVFTHSSTCNDYTGCDAGCGVTPVEDAVYENGAWRKVERSPSIREWLDNKFGRGYTP